MSADSRISPGPARAAFGQRTVLALLGLLALAAVIAFMTLGANGRWDFVLPFRGVKLAGMVLVAYAVAVSTILFQTVTHNRILTPSIMGFDALYGLIQTLLVFQLGPTLVQNTDSRLLFLGEVAAMVLFSGLLYRWLFAGGRRSLHLLLLVGVITGVLFRSISGFLQRIIDPNEFAILQDRLFASFNIAETDLLTVSAILIGVASVAGWRIMHRFDVLALGREMAVNLGVDYTRTVSIVLVIVAILVSVSTALVGPVTFFGLLVASLAWQIMPSHRHVHVLPAAVLIAVICVVGGQVVLERILAFDSVLSIVIEFVGGLIFLGLLLKGSAR
ncbi:iron chelate uptake ABC transporter family permease subunit, partial [Arvimicrobium flavum]|uniref:iron chelate uptake ABC transporter family permease subunit n=1 Tax=Arvimicrobium flavum TaxID=3393320 RepID=UPI00237A1BF3